MGRANHAVQKKRQQIIKLNKNKKHLFKRHYVSYDDQKCFKMKKYR